MKKLLLILILAVLPNICYADITSNLQGWWKFDEASSGNCTTNTPDSSGNNFSGTCVGSPTYIPGKIGTGAFTFGVSKYIQVTSVTADTDFSVLAWVNTTDATVSKYISTKYNGTAGFLLYMEIAGQMNLSLRAGNGFESVGDSTQVINDGNWHCVAATRSGSTWTTYIDSVQAKQATLGSGSLANNTTFKISSVEPVASNLGFVGSIDEVRYFSRQLSSSDVAQYCSYGLPVNGGFYAKGGLSAKGGLFVK